MRVLVSAFAIALAASCSVYDESLLLDEEDDGDGSGGGGGVTCSSPADCPGEDGPCKTRTCEANTCGFDFAPMGTPAGGQETGDCQVSACDGKGEIVALEDDGDVPNDGNACTIDACAGGVPSNQPEPAGKACAQAGGKKCDGMGTCVECLTSADCASQVCGPNHACAPAQCGDGVKNGAETDVDCGGGSCPGCLPGKVCQVGTDCVGGSCVGGTCAPTCTDGVENQTESDVDCGGPCAGCAIGASCNGNTDCESGNCSGSKCACGGTHVLISEVRTRGAGGGNDELVELYNPTNAPIVLDSTWKLEARGSDAMTYVVRWIGTGATIPAHGHYLIVGSTYAQAPAGDAILMSGISDAASVRLVENGSTVDAVCFYFNPGTLTTLTTTSGYECEGQPVSNLPHNDTAMGQSNSDVSIERKPGGALGNCIDTGDSSADFQSTMPALPQSTTSPPT